MYNQEIEDKYQDLYNTPSDINEHLPKLREYTNQCDHVTEFGVRGCVSLHAFLASTAKKIVAVDILNVAVPDSEKLTFINADTLSIEIEPTDFLFIDTVHNYTQLNQELKLHANKVNKFIGFHDTYTFGINGEGGDRGLLPAITEFLLNNPQWSIDYQTNINNGLIVLKK